MRPIILLFGPLVRPGVYRQPPHPVATTPSLICSYLQCHLTSSSSLTPNAYRLPPAAHSPHTGVLPPGQGTAQTGTGPGTEAQAQGTGTHTARSWETLQPRVLAAFRCDDRCFASSGIRVALQAETNQSVKTHSCSLPWPTARGHKKDFSIRTCLNIHASLLSRRHSCHS